MNLNKLTQRQPKVISSHKTWSDMQSNNAENIMTVQRPPVVGSSHQTWSELPTEDIKMVQRPPQVDSSLQILGEVKSENSDDIDTAQDPPELDSSHQMWVELQSDDSEDISNEHLIQPTENMTQREPVIKIENHQSSLQDPMTQSEESSKVVVKTDEFDMYGKFVASQLKKLSLDKALRLQVQIQNIVCQARLSDLSSC